LPRGVEAASGGRAIRILPVLEPIAESAYDAPMDDVTSKASGADSSDPPGLGHPAIERWLAEAVVTTFDAMQANPSRAIPASEVAATLDALHAEWLKNGGRGA
jgi:hypothetical protein